MEKPERQDAGRGPRIAAALVLVARVGYAAAGAAESGRIAELLRLGPGMTVADVGAGDGEWAAAIARRVGERGRVFATEVDAAEIDRIERRAAEDGLANLTAILGSAESTGLAAECCDAILLRLVYHHLTRPEPMRDGLLAALKPGGLIAVIDIRPQADWRELPGVPDRGGHGIQPDELAADMLGAGFELVERIEDWPGDEDRYCLLFRRPYQATP